MVINDRNDLQELILRITMCKDYGLLKQFISMHYVLVMVFKILTEPQYGYANSLLFANLYHGY